MINFKKNSIKNLASVFSSRNTVTIERDYASEIAEYFGAKPKRNFGSGDDEFNHYGKLDDILRAVKSDTDYPDVFTPKQKDTINMFRDGKFRRLNILDGSVRSGKTYISLILWALMISTRDYGERFIMVGRTTTTLKRNCLELLQELVGDANFSFSTSRKEAELFGRKIYLEGADNVLSEDKIRGMTLAGAYCDEITLLDEDFFRMLLSRLSVEGAFLLGTTNPDRPTHWLMRDYIKRGEELDLLTIKYLIDDNTFLPMDYIAKIKKEYVGVFYERFILGRWKAADGVVYPLFANNPELFIKTEIEPECIQYATIGVDFGGNGSAHAFVLNGFTKGYRELITLDEFYLKKEISPKELEDEFVRFVRKAKARYRVFEVYCDSAESTLIKGFETAATREKLGVSVMKAKKGAIIDRIRFYNFLMSTGRYYVLSHCENIIAAYKDAEWNSKSKDKDERLDDGTFNIDSLDACEYSTEPYMDTMIEIG
ncbi:MAG: PBSX family phage terminase large subunit [Clostridia bacterium]|nr:PBSX family phage terminase large subunit [Clostridia bacterium]